MEFSDQPPPEPPKPPPAAASGPCAWHDTRAAVAQCSACRTPICGDCATPISGGEMHGNPVCPACAPGAPILSSVPWESPEGKNFDTFKRSFFMPFNKASQLFTAFPARPLGPALGFAVLASIPSALLGVMWQGCMNLIGAGVVAQIMNNPQSSEFPPEFLRFIEQYGALIDAGFVAAPILQLLFVPLGVVFMTLIYHGFAWALGVRHDLVTTMRIVCYLYPLNVLQVVPAFGPILAMIFWIIGMKAAMQRVNGMTPTRAAIVALAPVIIAVLLGCCCCAGIIGIVAANA
ncbi:MAG: hypothetical protein ACYTGX_04240 [Planctomycetota bacterium]|jgi:hypothetical protein